MAPEELEALTYEATIMRATSGYISDANINKSRWDSNSTNWLAEPKTVEFNGEETTVYGTYPSPTYCTTESGKELESMYFLGACSEITFNETYDILTNLSCSKWQPYEDFKPSNQ